MNQYKSVAIIPARGGSKRIPRKNIRDFLGFPIIKYSIDAAIKSGIFDEIMVSTEDREIAVIAEEFGAKIPFYRSSETAGGKATLVEMLLEVIKEYEKIGKHFDYACVILSTAPFVTADVLKASCDILIKSKADGVVPVVQFGYPIQRAFQIEDDRLSMVWPENILKFSQELKPTYHDSGQFYWLDVKKFKEQKKFFPNDARPYILPETRVQDIDTEEDWKLAEMKYNLITNDKKLNERKDK